MIRGLPYDAEIEYLESTGTQWIDTRWGNNYIAELDVQGVSTTDTTSIVISTAENGGSCAWFGFQGGASSKYFSGFGTGISNVPYNTRKKVYIEIDGYGTNNRSIKYYFLDEPQTIYNRTDVSERAATNVILFRSLGTRNFPSFARIYSLKLWDKSTGILVRDFITVRVGTVGCMYDRVTKRLFGNAGAGAFVRGPDKARPVMSLHRYGASRFGKIGARDMLLRWRNPYATDGLIAMWDGKWNVGGGVHDPLARVWKDLVGNRDATLTEVGSFGMDCLVCDGGERSDGLSIAAAYCDSYIPQSAFSQVEVVYKLTSKWGRIGVLGTQGPQFVFAAGGTTKNDLGGTLYFTSTGTENYKRLVVDGKYLDIAYLDVESRFGSRVSTSVAYADGGDSREATYYALNGVAGTKRWKTARRNQSSVTTFGGVKSLENGNLYYGMSGEICCVRVYSRHLTAEERTANLAVDVSRFNISEAS